LEKDLGVECYLWSWEHATMDGRLCIRGRGRRSSVVSVLHILKWLAKFLASIESAFGNFADVPSVHVLFANVSLFLSASPITES
jgi:hypothetical protein